MSLLYSSGLYTTTATGQKLPPSPYTNPLIDTYGDGLGPLEEATNPVLEPEDVSDISDVYFVADPFLLIEDGTWHMFLEVRKGPDSGDYAVISHATSSDGVTWNYDQVVLDTGSQLSYPYVFKANGEYYMVPESSSDGSVKLFKADTFPTDWSLTNELVQIDPADQNVFQYNDKWWLFLLTGGSRDLEIYYSDTLESDGWSGHANNPIRDTANAKRPGGRIIYWDDDGTERLFIPFQQTDPNYGDDINYYEITELTTSTYSDTEVDNQMFDDQKNSSWNEDGMHHYDPWWQDGEGRWVAAVDGQDASTDPDTYAIGMWQVAVLYNDSATVV